MSEPYSEIITQPEPFEVPQPVQPVGQETRTPNNPPWGSGIAIGFWLLSVVLIVIVPGIFLAPYALSIGSQYPDSAELIKALGNDPTAIAIQIAAIVPAHLITLAIAWIVVTRGKEYSFTKTLGWRSGGMQWWHYIAILAGFFFLTVVIGYFLPEQENEMIRILRSSRYVVFLIAFMATFTAPLVEEVIYRGILYSALQRTIGVGLAFGIVTFLFATVHLPQYYPSISTMILLTFLSLVLTFVRIKTDNLLPCVILHTIFNGFQSMLLVVEPFIKSSTTADETVKAAILLLK